jgi:hypothetical protein
MHPFVLAVLLRLAWLNQLRPYAKMRLEGLMRFSEKLVTKTLPRQKRWPLARL